MPLGSDPHLTIDSSFRALAPDVVPSYIQGYSYDCGEGTRESHGKQDGKLCGKRGSLGVFVGSEYP